MAWIIAFLTITLLILINAFYVAAEFSTVSSRRSLLAQMAADGNKMARLLVPVVSDRSRLDTYVATCQIGITLSSLLLGFFGQSRLTPAVAHLVQGSEGLASAVTLSITAALVLLLLTTLQVILGELVPKSIGIQYPEKLALFTVLPMRWSTTLFKPFIWILNGSGRMILHLAGYTRSVQEAHTHVHTPGEILMLFDESNANGQLDKEERRLLKNSLELRQATVRQIMIPRNRMLTASVDASCEELLRLLADSHFSRLPLYDGNVDNIIGIVHLRDLLCLHQACSDYDIRKVIRPVLFVPESTPASAVFARLQSKHYHVAIILDEFGGTSGFLTLEDLIEEIFGELQDEFDPRELPPIRAVSKDTIELNGDLLIEELNEAIGLHLSSLNVDTIGGWVLDNLGYFPKIGEQVYLYNTKLVVEQMAGNAIKTIRMKVTPEQLEQLKDWTP
jgi:putative hemolysin